MISFVTAENSGVVKILTRELQILYANKSFCNERSKYKGDEPPPRLITVYM